MQLSYMGVAKVKVTASMHGDLVNWIDEQVTSRRFASRTHALEYAVHKLKELDSSAAVI
jgi:Arc/MetJ-type ribon-helix-helix transcriptional regulator